MANYFIPNNLRASSAGFAWGSLVFTDFNTACLRKILLQSLEIQEHVASKYGEVGKLNEDLHEQDLRLAGTPFLREKNVSRSITREVTLTGHVDFILEDGKLHPLSVDELKSVQSTNSRNQLFKHGKYKTENLAQLGTYMGEMRVSKGRLIYSFFQDGQRKEQRFFQVEIDRFGKIFVDAKATQFHYQDILSHQHAAAEVIATKKIASRPHEGERLFTGACNFCAYKKACKTYDEQGCSVDTFTQLAREGVQEKQRSAE